MAEPCNDARDDFSITMLADQDMGAGSPIADRDHELLGVPKRQNNVAPVSIQRIDRLMPTGLIGHRPGDPANNRGSYRRQH